MSANLRHYTTAIYGMDAVVRRVPADRWNAASPCDGWSARDVVIHEIGVFDGVAAMARSGELARPNPPEQVEDLLTAWTRSRDGLLESLDHPDVLRRSGSYWFGTTTIDDLLAVVMYDPLAHAWDVATAVGVDHHCSAEVAAAALTRIEEMAPTLREYGLIGEPVEVSEDADPVTRFLAIVGREPGH
jgi:uncharacterized protein (TIGR03086 family)